MGAEHGLLLVHAPLVVSRVADEHRAALGSCELLARLLSVVLEGQRSNGIRRPSLAEVRVPMALVQALGGQQMGKQLQALGRQLSSVAAYRQALLAQVRELEKLEGQTLMGWSDGSLGLR